MLPIIAGLLQAGLPIIAGAIASKGQELVQEKLGVDLSSALGSEEGRMRLKQLEFQHEEFLITAAQQADIRKLDYFKAETADRDSARQREVDMAKVNNLPWWVPSTTTLLAWLILAGGGYIFYNTAETDIRYAIVAIMTTVVSFYFGTTRNSGEKDKTFAAMLQKDAK